VVKTVQYGLTSTTERVEPNDYLTIVIKVPAPEPRCREQNATTIRKGRDTQLSGTKCRRATSAVAVVDAAESQVYAADSASTPGRTFPTQRHIDSSNHLSTQSTAVSSSTAMWHDQRSQRYEHPVTCSSKTEELY